MNPFLIHTMLAAGPGDWENTIWVQMLVLVILAASWGIYAFVKNRPNNLKDNERNVEKTGPDYTKSSWQFLRPRGDISRHKNAAHQKYSTEIQDVRTHTAKVSKSTTVSFGNSATAGQQKAKNKSARKRPRDMNSGIELLEPDLLLHIVHDTEGNDKNDVAMRKLAFDELLRRENQNRIDGGALAVYAVNRGGLYGKSIQCEAMKELAERTSSKGLLR